MANAIETKEATLEELFPEVAGDLGTGRIDFKRQPKAKPEGGTTPSTPAGAPTASTTEPVATAATTTQVAGDGNEEPAKVQVAKPRGRKKDVVADLGF
jgi:hypothetical protein